MKSSGEKVMTTAPAEVIVSAKQDYKAWAAVRTLVSYPIRFLKDTPDLEVPVADPYSLPENTNCMASAAAMSLWAWKMFEYRIEPTGKGFAVWAKFILLLILCVGLPLSLIYGVIMLFAKMSGLALEALKFTGWASLLCVSVIGLVLLIYLAYAVVMILQGKPFRVPEVRVKRLSDTEFSKESEDVIDVSADEGVRRRFFREFCDR